MLKENFKVGDYVLYETNFGFQIGRIKRIDRDGCAAFVYYHEGDTAARTNFNLLMPIINQRVIRESLLGGEDGNALFREWH